MFDFDSTTISEGKPEQDPKKNFCEIRIPLSYGHLAAKKWGNPDAELKVLALHGWQDNANSWDLLMPFLTIGDKICIVALDFSGHGHSSHLPEGAVYTHHIYVLDIMEALKFLSWDKKVTTLLGHSMGGGIAVLFSLLFPALVSKILTVDAVFPFYGTWAYWKEVTKGAYNGILKLRSGEVTGKKLQKQVFTKEEFFYKWYRDARIMMKDGAGACSSRGLEKILERGSTPAECGKFILNRDVRVKLWFPEVAFIAELPKLCQRLDKDMKFMLLKSQNGIDLFNEFYVILREECPKRLKNFQYHELEGAGHHVHLDDPESVADRVRDFILDQSLSSVKGLSSNSLSSVKG